MPRSTIDGSGANNATDQYALAVELAVREFAERVETRFRKRTLANHAHSAFDDHRRKFARSRNSVDLNFVAQGVREYRNVTAFHVNSRRCILHEVVRGGNVIGNDSANSNRVTQAALTGPERTVCFPVLKGRKRSWPPLFL